MLPLGLHFGLSEEEHHADPGLGSSDLKAILTDPCQWQFRRLAALREIMGMGDKENEGETLSKIFGTACHVMVLMGQEEFYRQYGVMPDKPDDVFATKDEIRAKLPSSVYIPSGAGLYEYETQAKLAGLKLFKDWKIEQLTRLEGKIEISRRWEATFRLINRMLDAPRPMKGGLSLRQAILTDGYPEVTFIWEENGLRLKLRFDWIRPGFVIDAKTYAAMEGREPIDAFVMAIARYLYHLQAGHYMDGYMQLPAALSEGRFFFHGDHPGIHPQWLSRAEWLGRLAIAAKSPPVWTWLAIQTVGMPHVDDVQFDAPSILLGGQGLVREAKAKYLDHVKRFGADDFWVSTRGTVLLEDLSFRPSINDVAAERWKII